MKYIITERQYKLLNEGIPLFIRRRSDDIELFITDALDETDTDDYNFYDYLDEICWQVVDKFGEDRSPEEIDQLIKYIINNHTDEIQAYYDFQTDDDEDYD